MSSSPKHIRDYLKDIQEKIDKTPRIQPSEETEDVCEICQGLGQIFIRLSEQDGAFPQQKLQPCPACEKGRDLAIKQAKHRSKHTQLPKRYAHASLSKWGDPKHPSSAGKVQAFFACREFVNHPKHSVSAHAVMQRVLKVYEDSRDEYILNNLSLLQSKLAQPDTIRHGIALWGDYGLGKTWMAAAAMNDLTENGEFVLYMRMSQLLQTLRDTWKTEDKTGDLLYHYSTVPVLFIDDMSDNSADDKQLPAHQQDFAAAIMRNRMGDMLPTLVTTNWDHNAFERKWGSVCAEVMFEGLHWIKVGGAKLRDITTELDVEL